MSAGRWWTGRWRAPDSLGYQEHVAAVGSIVATHFEEALTRRFGVRWAAREDGRGFEIEGIPVELLRVFSSRRADIDAATQELAAAFEARYGRKPSQREAGELAEKANLATRKGKEDGAIDWDALHEGWAAKLAGTLGVSLASVAPSVWRPGAKDAQPRDPSGGLSPDCLRRAAVKALALAQQESSTFTRADLVKHLGRVLPRTGMEPAGAARLVEELADRALRSEFEQVACLEAPEVVRAPPDLIRADGRSVFQRHGGTRYATGVQLSMEEKLVAQAQAQGAPHLSREESARLLGAPAAQLDAALRGRAQAAHAQVTQTGLRMDQAAAAHEALTSGRRVVVINAPAGSGKTRTLIETGRAWTAAGMGRVIGITPSQASRNTLAAGIPQSYNTAQFLGHLPGHRGARGRPVIGPGDLVLADEASMISSPDLADVVAYVTGRGAKLVLAGDVQQLQAVENGGGMSLLARRLGYARLAEPVRFAAAWEREASLRFRAGDTSVLADYGAHGRILGGTPEEMLEEAAQRYVALTLGGKDVLLMAQDHCPPPGAVPPNTRRAQVSRRGLARAGGEDRGWPGSQRRRSDRLHGERSLDAGRGTGPDPGQRRPAAHRGNHRERGHGPPGAGRTPWDRQPTVDRSGLPLSRLLAGRTRVRGDRPRRAEPDGAHRNGADHRQRDPPAGLRRDLPWHARQHRPGIHDHAQAGRPEAWPSARARTGTSRRLTAERGGEALPPTEPHGDDAAGVLASVLARDGTDLSALETQELSFSGSDNLAILHAQWQSETSAARAGHWSELLERMLPQEYRGEPGYQRKWLWRTLRSAELAGLDPAEVLATAITERDLAGARDVASVIDARIRRRTAGMVPLPQRPWSQHIPQAQPDHQQFVAELAAAMDERKERIGEHAAEHEPGMGRPRPRARPCRAARPAGLAAQGHVHRRLP